MAVELADGFAGRLLANCDQAQVVLRGAQPEALGVAAMQAARRRLYEVPHPDDLAADDLAARLVGPATLSAALTRLTELNAIKTDTSKRWDRTVGHPGMDIRIARLATALGEARV